MKQVIKLTESDLHNIVEDVASNVMNNLGMNGQTKQQPQQQQNNQMTAYQKSLTNYLNNMSAYMKQQFGEIDKKLEYIINGGLKNMGRR